ncbi:ankyrin repeat domain-containing protein, partial [Legionella drozanskii]
LARIISYIHPTEILNAIKLVSRKFYWLSYDIAYWRREFTQNASTYFERTISYPKTQSGFLEFWLESIIKWAIRNKSQSLLDSFYQRVIITRYKAWKEENQKKHLLIETTDAEGRTQNDWAAICNQLAEFKKLDRLQTEEEKITALVSAAKHGHLDLVKEILAKIDDDNDPVSSAAKTKGKNLALSCAGAGGHCDIIEVLLNHGAELDAIECARGTALMAAVQRRHYDTVDFLLKKGADVNAAPRDGLSALMIAVDRGYLEIVRLLLKNGANANYITSYDYSALYFAIITNRIELVKLLFEETNDSYVKRMAFKEAALRERLDIVRFFAKNNSYATNPDIFEALLLGATLRGNSTMLKAILTSINSDAIRSSLDILLTIAVLRANDLSATRADVNLKYFEIIEILSNRGAQIQDIDDSKKAALIYLISNHASLQAMDEQNSEFKDDELPLLFGHYYTAIAFLLEKGTDANTIDECGETALSLVARKGRLTLISLLLDYGADVNTPSRGKKTALMHAAQTGHLKAVEFLLKKGANVNATDDENNTALICAAEEGHVQIVALLLKSGVSHAQKAEALARATMKGQLEVVNLLRVEMVSRATVDYLQWRATEAPGHRLLNRFNHWYHGTSGIKRTENILHSIDVGLSPTQLMKKVKSAVEDSSHRKHSYSRYIFDVFKAPPTSTVNHQSDEEFLELKNEFLANFDQQFLSV